MSKLRFRASLSPIMSAIRIGGDTMRVSIDIPLTEQQNAIGLLALTDQSLIFDVDVDRDRTATPKAEPKERELKGPHSRFWQYLCRNGIKVSPELQEIFECEPGEIWDRLHEEFDVDTMAIVSPDEFEKWAEARHLMPLVTRSRLANRATEMAS